MELAMGTTLLIPRWLLNGSGTSLPKIGGAEWDLLGGSYYLYRSHKRLHSYTPVLEHMLLKIIRNSTITNAHLLLTQKLPVFACTLFVRRSRVIVVLAQLDCNVRSSVSELLSCRVKFRGFAAWRRSIPLTMLLFGRIDDSRSWIIARFSWLAHFGMVLIIKSLLPCFWLGPGLRNYQVCEDASIVGSTIFRSILLPRIGSGCSVLQHDLKGFRKLLMKYLDASKTKGLR